MKFPFKFMNVLAAICFYIFSTQNVLNAQSVVINEIMSKNDSTIEDIDGDFSDWIELYNPTDDPINLEGYGISDDEDDLYQWVIPDVTILPNGFALIFASGKDYTFGQLHSNFSLKAGGEDIFLTDADGELIDTADAIELAADQSFGRSEDGGQDWVIYSAASPGTFNSNGIVFNQAGNVVLNEIQSYNTKGIQDEDGEYHDWIELYNPNNYTINLNDYSLTDDEDEPDKWTFPNVSIEGGGFLLVFASDKDLTGGELHTNFGIKSSGEDIFLYDDDGALVDFVPEQQLIIDQTFGRATDGTGDWEEFFYGSPAESNDNGNIKQKLDFSHDGGQYADAFELDIYLEDGENEDGVSIYYTTDGSDPTLDSNLYEEALDIDSRDGDENYYSSSQFQTTESQYDYDPNEEVFKINIIRARIFKNGNPASKVYTKSYMIHPDFDRYTLPMISIVSDPENLFSDEKGLYVLGENYDGESEQSANFFQRGREWERYCHFEFFMEDEVIAQDAGLRIQGGGSRRDRQKSFRLYARSEYDKDNTFEYPFFPDKPIEEYKRLILRGQQSSNFSHFTDEVVSNMVRDINIDRMATRPAVVFLNGEYWGVYHIRERIDKYYLENNFGVDKDEVTLLEDSPYRGGCCIEGDSEEYKDLMDYISENDIRDAEVYNYVEQEIDLEQYANYLITEFWAGNYDWPGNNIRYWKGPGEDDKWRWILYDLDFGLRYPDRPSILNFIGNLTPNADPEVTELGNYLFENETFVNLFVELFEYHLKNTFSPEVAACEIITYGNLMRPEMEEYLDRFGSNFRLSYWDDRVEDMYEDYAAMRPCEIQDQILEQFDILIDIDECSTFEPDDTPCIFENQNACDGLSVNFTGLPPSMAIRDAVTLVGEPGGGTFSGPGVVFNSFNSSVLTPGQYTIDYTYEFENGCSVTTSESVLLYTIDFGFVNYNLGTIAPKVIDYIDLEGKVFEDDVYTFGIFDLSGKQIGQMQRHFSKGAFNERIRLDANLGKGVFFVNVATSEYGYSKKFIR